MVAHCCQSEVWKLYAQVTVTPFCSWPVAVLLLFLTVPYQLVCSASRCTTQTGRSSTTNTRFTLETSACFPGEYPEPSSQNSRPARVYSGRRLTGGCVSPLQQRVEDGETPEPRVRGGRGCERRGGGRRGGPSSGDYSCTSRQGRGGGGIGSLSMVFKFSELKLQF